MTLSAKPLLGLNTVLSIGTLGGTPTYTAIGGNTKVVPPEPSWGTEDITTLDQATPSRQFMKALIDQGEAEGSGFWESADPGQIALYAAFLAPSNQVNGANYPFKLVLPIHLAGGQATTGDTATFSALVIKFAMGEADPGKPIPYKFTLKINGTPAPTFTEGS